MKLRIELPSTPFLAGGVIPVRLVLENTGTTAVNVPPANRGSPFTFTVNDRVRNLSVAFGANMRNALLSGGSLPPERGGASLQPKETLVYEDDLGRVMVERLLPGVYSLKATLATESGLVESPPVPLRLEAPSVIALTHSVSADRRRVVSVLAAAEGATGAGVFASYSPVGHPELGEFRRCVNVKVGKGITSLCLAAETMPSPDWRWAAWIDNGRIGGVMTMEFGSDYTFADQDPGVASPSLVAGFQDDRGLATFVVAGQRGAGQGLALFHIRGVGEFQRVDSALELPAAARPQIAGRYEGTSLMLSVYWLADGNRLVTAKIDGEKGAVLAPPRDLFVGSRRILSFQLPGGAAGGIVVALDRDAAKTDSAPTLVDVNPESGAASGELSTGVPPAGLTEWIFSAAGSAQARAVGIASKQAFSLRPGNGSSAQPLTAVPAGASHLQLLSLDLEAFWLVFVAPSVGVGYVRLN